MSGSSQHPDPTAREGADPAAAGTGPAPRTTLHRAGAFDIRTFIASLIGIYGIVLVIVGLVGGHHQVTKAAGVNVNLWAGVAMLVAAVVFVAWARLRPVVVPEHHEE
jgi:hypothetical protein